MRDRLTARVLREDDPAALRLLQDGWQVLHRSWGARLLAERVDRGLLEVLVRAAVERGYRLAELDPESDGAVIALELANRDDYPGGPTTAPPVRSRESLARDRAAGTRWFGAMKEGVLVAATAIRRGPEGAETDTTSVAAAHRRRGLAEAVKAASVLALLEEGVMLFGTGGADENAPSLAMNRRVGYEVVERWLTLEAPV